MQKQDVPTWLASLSEEQVREKLAAIVNEAFDMHGCTHQLCSMAESVSEEIYSARLFRLAGISPDAK